MKIKVQVLKKYLLVLNEDHVAAQHQVLYLRAQIQTWAHPRFHLRAHQRHHRHSHPVNRKKERKRDKRSKKSKRSRKANKYKNKSRKISSKKEKGTSQNLYLQYNKVAGQQIGKKERKVVHEATAGFKPYPKTSGSTKKNIFNLLIFFC